MHMSRNKNPRVTVCLTEQWFGHYSRPNLMCIQSHPCKIAPTPFYKRHGSSRVDGAGRRSVWDKADVWEVEWHALRGVICWRGKVNQLDRQVLLTLLSLDLQTTAEVLQIARHGGRSGYYWLLPHGTSAHTPRPGG